MGLDHGGRSRSLLASAVQGVMGTLQGLLLSLPGQLTGESFVGELMLLSDTVHAHLWQPVLSPLEGTKMTVNNLHPRVTEEDIVVSTTMGT